MRISSEVLCIAYGLIALLALLGTWGNNRERALAAREPSTAAGTLGVFDIAGIAAVTVAIVAYTAVALLTA